MSSTVPAPPSGSAGRAVRASLLASLAIVAINLGTGVITAHALGPAGRAIVITATVWTSLSAWASAVGIDKATQYQSAAHPEQRPAQWTTSILTGTLSGVVGAVLAQFLVNVVIRDDYLRLPVREFLVATALFIGYEILCSALSGAHLPGRAALLRVLQPLAYLTFLLAGLLSPNGLTPDEALLGLGGSFAVAELVGIVWLVRHVGVTRPRAKLVGSTYRIGLRVYPGSLATLANARIDLLLLPAFVAAAPIGYYGVAANTANILQIALGNLGNFLLPSLVAKQGIDRARSLERGIRLTLGLGVAMAAVGCLAAGPVVRLLYGDAFAPSIPLLRILLVAAVALTTLGVVANGLTAHGRPLRSSIANLIGVPITAVGLTLFVGDYGVTAAAWVSLAAYSACLIAAVALTPPELMERRRLLSIRAWRDDLTELRRRIGR